MLKTRELSYINKDEIIWLYEIPEILAIFTG